MMTRNLRLAVVALLACCGTLLGDMAIGHRAVAATKVASLEGITEYRLDNGLQVLLYPDPSKPKVTVNLTVFVGSRHEGYGETGMAHLLEHMLFKGTPDHGKIPKLLQDRGAEFNGTTWLDRTNYFETLPATDENLKFALELEADRMMNSFVKQEDLLSEMTVVRNEFERGENSPSLLLNQRVLSAAYDWHNYGKSTIGNRSDIERVPIDRLKAFYRKYYQPDNAMVVVAGKFDPDKALKYIEETFGKIPKPKRKLDKTYTEEPAQDGERMVTLRRVGDVGIVAAAYHVPSGGHPDIAPVDVLANILETAPSGRLYKAMVETGKATRVGASAGSFHDPGVLELEAEVLKEKSLDDARETMIGLVEDLGSKEFTKEEVERAKQQILKERELNAAKTTAVAIDLSNWAAQGDWRLYLLHRDRVEKVTPDDVRRVAKDYLRRSNRTVGVFIPTEKPDRADVPPTPKLADLFKNYRGRAEVAAGETFEVTPAHIDSRTKRSKLPEGIKVALLPKRTRGETVQVRVTLRYGSPESLKGFEKACEFLPAVMTRGTKSLSRLQIEDALDSNRATLNASGDVGVATFTLETKRANLPEVLGLLRQILREPSFPADEFEVLHRQELADLEVQRTDPQALAMTAVRRAVSPYDKDDVRYIPTVDEELARTRDVSRDKIEKLYRDFLGSQAGEIAIVGDFDPEANAKILKETLADWNSKQPYERITRRAFPDVPGGKQRIETPDKANAVYLAGLTFPMKDTDPDYPALVLGNFVLGAGSLSSRLGDRVRQKDGLSYGIASMMGAESLDPRASITVFAICNPDNIEQVNTAILEEINRLLDDGIPKEELERAKQGYLQKQQVTRTSDSNLAVLLTDAAFADRTMAYYGDLESKINALTSDQVVAALKKRLDPKRLVVVNAGDFNAKDSNNSANATGAAKDDAP